MEETPDPSVTKVGCSIPAMSTARLVHSGRKCRKRAGSLTGVPASGTYLAGRPRAPVGVKTQLQGGAKGPDTEGGQQGRRHRDTWAHGQDVGPEAGRAHSQRPGQGRAREGGEDGAAGTGRGPQGSLRPSSGFTGTGICWAVQARRNTI